MERKMPNPETYRPLLGAEVNTALLQLVEHRNAQALQPLGVNEYLRKMIAHWWNQEFPGVPFPAQTKPYQKGIDFEIVQSEEIVQSA
jgi:hypothetical protein